MKICSIILARPESSRLPKKHTRLIGNKMELDYIIDMANVISDVVVIASTNSGYKEIFENKVDYYMSFDIPVDDINLRIKKVHQIIKADYYFIISGDCPVISKDICERMLYELYHSKKDCIYGVGNFSVQGIEIIKGTAINKLIETNNICMLLQPKLMKHPVVFKEKDSFRLTIDTHLDLFFHRMLAKETDYTYKSVIKYLENNPMLTNIVGNTTNTLSNMKLLLVCESNKNIGVGHLSRTIAQAEMYNQSGASVRLNVSANELTVEFLSDRGFIYDIDYEFTDSNSVSHYDEYDFVLFDTPEKQNLSWMDFYLVNPTHGVSKRLWYYKNKINKPQFNVLQSFGLGDNQKFIALGLVEVDYNNYDSFYDKLINYKKIITTFSQTAREAMFLGLEVECYSTNQIDTYICKELEKQNKLKWKGEIK